MAKIKESSVTFKCDEDFLAWLGRETMELDKSKSEIIRACIVLALPQIKALRGLDRVCLEDIRP